MTSWRFWIARTAPAAFIVFGFAANTSAQTLTDTLSFLLTNRSVATGDFQRDEQAAARMRDAFVQLLQAELTNLPITSPASGFTYRLDSSIGVSVRSTNSFAPFYTERSLTGGRQFSLGVGVSQADFVNVDGRSLRDGALIATASQLQGEAQPFDAETLTLRLRTRTVTVTALAGLTDRLDISAAVPLIRIDLNGSRVDNYRGLVSLQAAALAHATGIGDVVLRAKYNVLRSGGSGLAVGADVRLPTGDSLNLLGTGERTVTPRVIGSFEYSRIAVHGQVGFGVSSLSNELSAAGALTFAATPRVTLVGELLGRRVEEGGRLVDVVDPHPTLVGVSTIRLSSAGGASNRLIVVGGLRWNAASRWLISASVIRPVSTPGLNARWIGAITLDFSIGG